ncbi:hypothetical protein Alsa1_CDS0220 [Staphylococcus phage Alsa_1]|nr:hypothetical protein Alsa1_CDS0220 [Staphylococcus phage Alsa_1]WNM50810.1 hypothetical protein Alsa2_CDS0196 [Staphylococcus phage Alsa_2]WNM50948.1 hypothetical protein Alsa3_CDS0079 [Staphylococcus phage Alsa_3]WNM51202.1 hypothetical protein Alsa4_CDS0072 [Staphylococcus phage Alsa_4]
MAINPLYKPTIINKFIGISVGFLFTYSFRFIPIITVLVFN